MCGIAGVYSLTDRPPDPEWGPLLIRALRHRGPDGDGVYSDQRVVLAHTRLAIIDLTEGGRQPMASGDGRRLIVLNGEIYNHAEIRAGLESEGVRFRSRSDTEVLLESLARRGRAALDQIRGMFAFALYDRESGELTLARDRLGKRPLLYVRTPEYFAFASEAQALLRLPFVRPRLDRTALLDYARYLYVPAPRTLVQGMRKLPQASVLTIPGNTGRPSAGRTQTAGDFAIERYWAPPVPDSGGSAALSEGDLDRRLDELLLDSTRLRTVSDVPIGVFLSGGIDSNTVLAMLHRAGHHPIRAFTVGFEGYPDERPLARLGARAHADDHVELEIRPDVAEEVPSILRHFGEPLGDSAIVTTYLIAREASRHVKVILNGDGGDELFGGYARYPFARRLDLAAAVPGGLSLARGYYARRPHLAPVFDALARHDPSLAVLRLGSHLAPGQGGALFAPNIREEAVHGNGTPNSFAGSLFAHDTDVYLPDDLLVKVDLASMAHGLENRSPFLDHRLFELIGSLGMSRRTHPWITKPILRRLVRDRIPPKILRARKTGFQLPLSTWLHGPLAGWLDGLLRDPQATRTLYREGALAAELDRFHTNGSDVHACARLWSLAVLELWAREFSVEVSA